MQSAAQAYGSVAKQIANPRELEAQLLLKAAARLQSIKDEWNARAPELSDALLYNRRLWTVLLAAVASEDSPLPLPIRQNVANLGLFVMNRSMEMTGEPAPERLGALININRELAAGLLGR